MHRNISDIISDKIYENREETDKVMLEMINEISLDLFNEEVKDVDDVKRLDKKLNDMGYKLAIENDIDLAAGKGTMKIVYKPKE